jgi:uncharacterized integral membrane protein (TIGR00698 family)
MVDRFIFVCLLIAVALPTRYSSPALALIVGALFGLLRQHPFPKQSRRASKLLLQAAVVGLGFAMDLHRVLLAGAHGFIYTAIGIAFALVMGMGLGKLLSVEGRSAYLISVGTAICGGSAIAAVGPVMEATDEEMSVSVGTVFLLNAIGLILFPVLGHKLALNEPSFGLWSALAIHDTSSVVGAASQYGVIALAIATTVKLTRALWIVPVTLATAAWRHRTRSAETGKRRIELPWFIGLFLLAAMMNTYVPAGKQVYPWIIDAAKIGLKVTLFLIGTGISRDNLRRVGFRPLAQGVLLWVAVAAFSLLLIHGGWARI